MTKIMIIDDAKDFCQVLNHFLSRHGYDVVEAHQGKKALDILLHDKELPDLILCDFRLNDMDGTAILKTLKEKKMHVPVVIVSGYGNIKTAVDVMKMGAEDYLVKPFIPEEILGVINNAIKQYHEKVTRSVAVDTAQPKSQKAENPKYIFKGSSYFKNILKQIDIVAPTDYSVIIYGESGSGKEAIAQEIHKRSKRSGKPFIPIDCGVLTKELANSELFGHEKGAFTGAHQQKMGSFELANEGTIFLDEISNLPYDVQMTLLRVVQERKMRRVGGTTDIDLDVRIIVASNEKLWDASGGGKIREDLFHRFNEFVIYVAPLRERKDDLMIFANHFLELANEELHKNIRGFNQDVENLFRNYTWHGNLRELRNVVKRAALLCEGELITADNVPYELIEVSQRDTEFLSESFAWKSDVSIATSEDTEKKRSKSNISLKSAGIDAEYELIIDTLRKVNFNKSKAAKLLQIDRKTLYYKINQYHELKGKKQG